MTSRSRLRTSPRLWPKLSLSLRSLHLSLPQNLLPKMNGRPLPTTRRARRTRRRRARLRWWRSPSRLLRLLLSLPLSLLNPSSHPQSLPSRHQQRLWPKMNGQPLPPTRRGRRTRKRRAALSWRIPSPLPKTTSLSTRHPSDSPQQTTLHQHQHQHQSLKHSRMSSRLLSTPRRRPSRQRRTR
ncbi:hypothetical protein F5X68DRAFT_202551 [Plectosphaerella plurivora]|uniref:Uncharacterized protein n=1 Tax=Plectosphaerella plurivora TaxID=936078 RepID=A0A9P9AB01_9PEZI|nr:hypothetical protein F5X68DRAFT_202551 [Plectosphaerella plurivora]